MHIVILKESKLLYPSLYSKYKNKKICENPCKSVVGKIIEYFLFTRKQPGFSK